jgi:hypothetical protein
MVGMRAQGLRVFVICPAGAEGSAARRHMDGAMANLVLPALAEAERLAPPGAGLHFDRQRVHRSDALSPTDGDLAQQMAKALRDADLVIAVLTYDDPGALYALGVADCVGRPIALARQHNRKPVPGEIARRRFTRYRGMGDASGVADLADQVVASVVKGGRVTANAYAGPFDGRLDAFGPHNASAAVFERFSGIPYTEYSRLFQDAERFIWLAGTSLLDFSHADIQPWDYRLKDRIEKISFPQFIYHKLAVGVDVTIMMMGENNPALPHMIIQNGNDFLNGLSVEKVREEITRSERMWRLIRGEALKLEALVKAEDPDQAVGHFRIIKVERGIIYSRVSITEKETLVSPNYYALPRNGHGPSIRAISNTNFYQSTLNDLRYLESKNSPIEDDASQAGSASAVG